MIPLIEEILFLEKVPLFKDLTVEELGKIAAITKTEEYEEGEVLFMEGEPGETAFVVISGSVEIYRTAKKSKDVVIQTFKSGDCFGEMSLFDGEPRSASARTKGTCILSSYTKNDLDQVIKQYPGIAISIINILSKRLRAMTDKDIVYKGVLTDFKALYKRVENYLG